MGPNEALWARCFRMGFVAVVIGAFWADLIKCTLIVVAFEAFEGYFAHPVMISSECKPYCSNGNAHKLIFYVKIPPNPVLSNTTPFFHVTQHKNPQTTSKHPLQQQNQVFYPNPNCTFSSFLHKPQHTLHYPQLHHSLH